MAANPIATLVRHFLVLANETPFLCEDCKLPTDLGHKCRACYAKWSRALWADIPEQHALISQVVQELKRMPDGMQRAIALNAAGASEPLSGEARSVQARVQQVLAGPFGPNMHDHLRGIRSRPSEGASAPAPRSRLS